MLLEEELSLVLAQLLQAMRREDSKPRVYAKDTGLNCVTLPMATDSEAASPLTGSHLCLRTIALSLVFESFWVFPPFT